MTTQYTPILRLALPVEGELDGTWGDIVNDSITSMVEQAIAGAATINTWTANVHTLTTADGTTSEARCAVLIAQTGSGGTALTAAGQIICPTATKLYTLKNDSAYAVTLKTAAGSGIAVAAGTSVVLFCDGTNVVSSQTTFSGGTANGVLYLNGSQVASSGSALTFDGTYFTANGLRLAGADVTNTIYQATGALGISTGTASGITFATNLTTRMTLDGSGNLGIGTASPQAKLHVSTSGVGYELSPNSVAAGNGTLIESYSRTGSIYVPIRAIAEYHRWDAAAGERMRLFASGSLTIGGTNDSARLRVEGTTNLTTGLQLFRSGNSCSALWTESGALRFGVDGSTGFTELMQLTLSGNLGIGTASPGNALEIARGAGVAAGLSSRGNGNSAANEFFVGQGGAGNAFVYQRANSDLSFGTNNTTRMFIDASGNVGIGTASPGAKLEVYGGASGTVTNIQAGNASTGFVFGIDGSNNCQIRTAQNVAMFFYTNATQRMQISADGNHIVGTAALATTATAGFPWIPSCAGIPTGAPTAPYTNAAAMVVDTTNNRLYVRVGSTWRYATLT